jgi:hypothetical protein
MKLLAVWIFLAVCLNAADDGILSWIGTRLEPSPTKRAGCSTMIGRASASEALAVMPEIPSASRQAKRKQIRTLPSVATAHGV